MNGIRLPDQINERMYPLREGDPANTVQNGIPEARFEALKNSSPRYTVKCDIESNPISAMRLANRVGDENRVGRNGYLMTYRPRNDRDSEREILNNGKKVLIGNKYYKMNQVSRPLRNEPPKYVNLNSTIGSLASGLTSYSESFEDKYYRTNDPDDLEETKPSNRYKKNQLNQSNIQLNKIYKDRIIKYKPKGKKNKESIFGERMNSKELEIAEGDETQYCKLTREELGAGLGSLGLAVSKVIKFTGKGMLYLFSSITDNAEYLFETKKPEKRNHRCKHHEQQQREHTPRICHCNQGYENDCANTPNLHINYEQDYRDEELQGDISIRQNGIYINGNKLELSPNIVTRRYPNARRENTETYRMQYEGRNYEDGRYGNRDYFRANDDYEYYERRQESPEYFQNRMTNNYDLRVEGERRGGYMNKQEYGPKNSFDMEYPSPNNVFMNSLRGKDREVYRNVGTQEIKATKGGPTYNYYQKYNLNRQVNEIRAPETVGVTPIQISSGSVVMYSREDPKNTSSRNDNGPTRQAEMRTEISEPNGFDKYKSFNGVERVRKNQVTLESIGKPTLNPCGERIVQERLQYRVGQPKSESVPVKRRENLMPNDNTGADRMMVPEISELEKAKLNREGSESTGLMEVRSQMNRVLEQEKKEEFISIKDLDQNKIIDTISISGTESTKGLQMLSLGQIELKNADDKMSSGQTSAGSDVSKKTKKKSFSLVSSLKK